MTFGLVLIVSAAFLLLPATGEPLKAYEHKLVSVL
jgi:hypothetical protein